MKIEVQKIEVNAQGRKLKNVWTVEESESFSVQMDPSVIKSIARSLMFGLGFKGLLAMYTIEQGTYFRTIKKEIHEAFAKFFPGNYTIVVKNNVASLTFESDEDEMVWLLKYSDVTVPYEW